MADIQTSYQQAEIEAREQRRGLGRPQSDPALGVSTSAEIVASLGANI